MKKIILFSTLVVITTQLRGMEQTGSQDNDPCFSATYNSRGDESLWDYYRRISPTNSQEQEKNTSQAKLEQLKAWEQETFKKSRRQLLSHKDVTVTFKVPESKQEEEPVQTAPRSLQDNNTSLRELTFRSYDERMELIAREKRLAEQEALEQQMLDAALQLSLGNSVSSSNNNSIAEIPTVVTNLEMITTLAVGLHTIAAGSKRPCVRLFDEKTGKEQIPLFDANFSAGNFAQKIIFGGDNEDLLCVGYQDHITLHKVASGKIIKIFSSNQKIKNFIFTDNKLIALSCYDGIVFYGIFDTREKQNQLTSSLTACVDNPTFLDYLPKLQETPTYETDDKAVLFYKPKELRVHNKNSNEYNLIDSFAQYNGTITAIDLNKITNTLAIGTEDGIIKWTREY